MYVHVYYLYVCTYVHMYVGDCGQLHMRYFGESGCECGLFILARMVPSALLPSAAKIQLVLYIAV